jgi:hypothetical protein
MNKCIIFIFLVILYCCPSKIKKEVNIDTENINRENLTLKVSVIDTLFFVTEDCLCERKTIQNVNKISTSMDYTVDDAEKNTVRSCIYNAKNIRLEFDQTVSDKEIEECSVYLNDNKVDMAVQVSCSIDEYPFSINSWIDCGDRDFFEFVFENSKYLLVVSSPINWTGRMSSFAFYQIINMQNFKGVQTVANKIDL